MTSVNFHVEELAFGKTLALDGLSVTLEVERLQCRRLSEEYAVELGSFILIEALTSNLIATISAINLSQVGSGDKTAERRTATCNLVGFLRGGVEFERGVERYPTVGSKAYLLTQEALTAMFRSEAGGVRVGERCQRGAGKEYVKVDKLFGRHTAILGTSGSGKSWTVASLIQSVMETLAHTRIVFFDLHDEYRNAFPPDFQRIGRRVSHIPSNRLVLPYWILTFEEWADMFLSSEHTAINQAALLTGLIQELKLEHCDAPDKESITVDTPAYFNFEALIDRLRDLDQEKVPGAKKEEVKGPWNGKLSNLVLRLEAKRKDPRYAFLFPGKRAGAELDDVLSRLLGITDDTQLSILDLSGLPSEVLSTIVGILCRLIFDYKYWEEQPSELPITLVLEEAHNYLPKAADARTQVCTERVERVAKEGRKYGIGLVVVSQRPSELSETVLSQCANFFVLRMTNPNDQQYVRKLLPDFLAVAVDMLPYLRTGEVVIVGEAVSLPTRVRIEPPNPVPRSEDVAYLAAWEQGLKSDYSVAKTTKRWRRRER